MKNAFDKGIVRDIKDSLGRFLAIAAIVALGAGFYAGLRMTCPDMKLSADLFYDDTELMDIRVVCTLGLTDEDLEALDEVEGVQGVMAAYETDIMGELNDEGYAMRVHSLPEAALDSDTSSGTAAVSDDEDYLNRPILTSGRWPQEPGECVISSDIVIGEEPQIGDVITIKELVEGSEDMLVSDELVVVGTVSSSYYATSANLGSTSLGSGSIQDYVYVCEEEFSADVPYTEIFLTVEGASELNSSQSDYDELVAEVEARIEEVADERADARTQEVVGDAQAEVDEAWEDYEAGRAEVEAELSDSQAELDDAAAQIADAQEQIDEGQADYDEGTEELAAQREEADAELAAAEVELAEAQEDYDEATSTRADLAAQLAEAQEGLDQVDAGLEEADAALEELDATIEALTTALAASQAAAEQTAAAQTEAAAAQLAEAQAAAEELQAQRDELAAQRQTLQEGADELEAAIAAIDEQTEGVPSQISAGWAALEEQEASADSQIAAAQQELDDAADELEDAREELAQSQEDYEEGEADLEEARTEADEGFAEAEQELAEAQEEVDAIEAAEWYVMDRDDNYGVVAFESDAERIDSIASIFPLIFFIVAALVSLATMTRMVEEERGVIGTYKALGYSRGRIAWKYLSYALLASVIGSIVGIAILSQVLPAVIMYAYAIIYFVPQGPLPINGPIAAFSAGVSIGVTALATVASVFATLREKPAALMLPRTPKAGKRILLERARPLWSRLSFSWKVTCRNIFRDKKRFFMTLVGVSGCTALLLTGLGLSDSINDIIDKQFYEILTYNATIGTDEDIDADSEAQLEALLADEDYVSDSLQIGQLTMSARGMEGDEDLKVQVVAASDTDRLGDFVDLRTRQGHEAVEIPDDGAVLSEKLASELGLSVGDSIVLVEQDEIGNPTGETHELEVTGIVENYIYYYVYTGPGGWDELAGADAPYESWYAVCTTDAQAREDFSETARAIDGVKTVSFTDETIETYRDMIASVNLIVIVLIVCAAALDFIVTYNLTNINISERVREIATLKVLGFTKGEVEAYVYRETILLTILGALVGLVFGIFLEGYVVVTAEVDQVMFGRAIHASSFVLALLLTVGFSAFVMFVMRGKIAHVSMVESLKSNE